MRITPLSPISHQRVAAWLQVLGIMVVGFLALNGLFDFACWFSGTYCQW